MRISPCPGNWSGPVLLLVVGSFFIVILTENSRIPVDDPDTHLELTMIHEVMILDHSGVDLGYMLYASAIKLFVFAGILVPIIFPITDGKSGIEYDGFFRRHAWAVYRDRHCGIDHGAFEA